MKTPLLRRPAMFHRQAVLGALVPALAHQAVVNRWLK